MTECMSGEISETVIIVDLLEGLQNITVLVRTQQVYVFWQMFSVRR